MTVYTYDFISLITHSLSAPFVSYFAPLHMELIRIVGLVNARIAQLESSFQVLAC